MGFGHFPESYESGAYRFSLGVTLIAQEPYKKRPFFHGWAGIFRAAIWGSDIYLSTE